MAQVFVDAALLTGVLLLLYTATKLAVKVPYAARPSRKPLLQEVNQSRRKMIIIAVNITVTLTVALYVMTLVGKWIVLGFIGAGFLIALLNLVRHLATTTWHAFVLIVTAGVAVVAWVIWRNWLTIDILGVILAMGILLLLLGAFNSFKAAATLAGALFVYDILNVFGTGNMIKLAHVVLDYALPLMIVVPSPSFFHSQAQVGLGMGDIVIPGMLVLMASVVAHRHNQKSIKYLALLGYGVGLVFALVAVEVTHMGQPALLYLYPCVMGGILAGVWRTGLWAELESFKGKKPESSEPSEAY